MLREMLENVRKKAPRIHCITNYVTMNDCANVLLACGASPIMANDEAETAEITALCDGLTINIGTLSRQAVPAMLAAGKRANELGHPVVLDPVGAGASAFRTETALQLLSEIRFSAIRGNVSEIRALSSGACGTKGVDANEMDQVTAENLDRCAAFARVFSEKTGAVVAMTGTIDIVADAARVFLIRNGHPMMSRVTGTGCQLSVLTAAFLAANHEKSLTLQIQQPDRRSVDVGNQLTAVAAAVCAMGLCGEKAYQRLTALDGNASYRNYIIDAIFHLTPEELEREADYEMR
ncbi:MAG: hydroxyethylthiazole kinase [Lachnospiraceae bacterium]|nr:hydroxyethylthiazole kinase [Lachnospiraceae bacterium]